MLIEPAGVVMRLLAGRVKVPIHGPEARQSSRHTIDQAGSRSALERPVETSARCAAEGGLSWRDEGVGAIDNRATYVLARHLPYTGPGGRYPDARLVVHLDQEWLVPVAILSYADRQEKVLLGSYVITHLALNPGRSEVDFRL